MKRTAVVFPLLLCFAFIFSGCPTTRHPWAFIHKSSSSNDPPILAKAIPGLSDQSGKAESNPQYVTEEDLLKVVNEFQRVAAKDSYRFTLPKDVTGATGYKPTPTRLQD